MPDDKSNVSSLFENVLGDQELHKPPIAKSSAEALAEECRMDMSLAERFLVPPFDVLNATQPYWHQKQEKWIPVFDPLLCEIVYRWAMPSKTEGHILDPFATESTRGIIAASLGYRYTGFEPRRKKIEVNERQAMLVQAKQPKMKRLPKWICADPMNLDKHVPANESYDLIFTDIPIYKGSEDPDECIRRCQRVFAKAIACLKQPRFVIITARDYRQKDGWIRLNVAKITVMLTNALGLHSYNKAVLLMSGNYHESLLWFVNGNDELEFKKAFPRLDDCRDLAIGSAPPPIPTFDVLNANSATWRRRKKVWTGVLSIDGGAGRDSDVPPEER